MFTYVDCEEAFIEKKKAGSTDSTWVCKESDYVKFHIKGSEEGLSQTLMTLFFRIESNLMVRTKGGR